LGCATAFDENAAVRGFDLLMKAARALRTSGIKEASHGLDNVTVENLTVLMKSISSAPRRWAGWQSEGR